MEEKLPRGKFKKRTMDGTPDGHTLIEGVCPSVRLVLPPG
jgi:hypothetical protein